MYQRRMSSWVKHLDFTILDCLCIELAFIIAYLIRHGGNIYYFELYRDTAGMLVLLHLVVVFLGESYNGIVRRGYFEEFKAAVIHVTTTDVLLNLYLYLMKKGGEYSRVTYVMMWSIGILLVYIMRILWKQHLSKRTEKSTSQNALLIVTLKESAEKTIELIKKNNFGTLKIIGLVLLDDNHEEGCIKGIPIVASQANMVEFIRYNWVDEVLFDVPYGMFDCEKLMDDCELMGVTIHQKLALESELYRQNQVIEKLAGFTVLTSSVSLVSNRELFFKRILDIAGGIFGVLITVILCVFIAPCIWIKSPGTIFFSQWRVGKNGKKFKIYKFRSMYMDAEERKQDLMEKNNIQSGLMFKIENDPRVIKGIGEFIRKTSLDEFPQFMNILKGDMSLVGTRPPTIDEWNQYEIYHRKRMAIKPGLTGMWQVSGRNKITDFDQVVELDTKYIKEWSLGLDLRILFKTIVVVLKREGAS